MNPALAVPSVYFCWYIKCTLTHTLQADELTALQSEHTVKLAELASQRENFSLEQTRLTQEQARLAALSNKLATDKTELDREMKELETRRAELASQRGTLEGSSNGQAVVKKDKESLIQLQRYVQIN